jgi:hypothetical protein
MQLSSWRWAQSRSKHVEDSNKHIIEEVVRQVDHLPEASTMLSNNSFKYQFTVIIQLISQRNLLWHLSVIILHYFETTK